MKMNSKSYQLLAVDMDGTLLTSEKKILPETMEAIEAAVAMDKTIVLGTGRGVPELTDYLSALSLIRYGICLSGSLVYDFKERKAVSVERIEQETILKIAAVARRFDGMLHLLAADESIVEKSQVTHLSDFNMGIYQSMFSKITVKVDDLAKECEKRAFLPKVNIYFRTVADRLAGYAILKSLPLNFAFAEGASLEMTPAGVNKGSGLIALSGHLGIDIPQTIAVGDADNDKEMIKTAGLGVAMGNADSAIKDIADVVVSDNDHDGVGEAIRRYLLR